VEHIDKVCLSLREQYGRCVKITGLLGRPDMLFVFDAGEVERVFRGEDAAPHRYIHTCISLTRYPRRGIRGISDSPLRRPLFTEII
jgi:hypothetical protein